MKRHLILNRIKTPDGTILTSYHRHDYKLHTDTITGEDYMVDGGLDYERRSINKIPYIDLSVYSDDDYEIVRQSFHWKTYGKTGESPMRRVILCEMSNDHLEAILMNRTYNTNPCRYLFEKELAYREEHGIKIKD